jgi:Uncharacterized protein conserved in bacteria (DUF2252)
VLERLAPKFTGHQGQRVVEGQRVMQAASDIFLGWTEDVASHLFLCASPVKNRRLGSIGELVEQEALATYAHLCGRGFAQVAYPNTAILGRAFHSHRHAAQLAHYALVHVPPAPCYVSWTCVAGTCLTCSVKSIFFDKPPSKRSFGWDTWDRRECHTIPFAQATRYSAMGSASSRSWHRQLSSDD